MTRIKEVKVEIITENEEEEESTNLFSPTIDLAIEKMGAFERSLNRRDSYDLEKEAEDKESDDVYKGQELEADKLVTIEK